MKTWEMIKAIEEGSIKKYANGRVIYGNKNEQLTLFSKRLDSMGFASVGHNIASWKEQDWQEIKQPVTWQEALEAWANGKNIYHITGYGKTYIVNNCTLIYRTDIKTAKWYIGNPDD